MKFSLFSKMKNHLDYSLIICLLIAVLSIIIRYPAQDSYNYKNSDATQHVLLTMEAYKETPISVHKFLPIVSLGAKEDKNIPWGATIPDKQGNYYYTSFSPTNFFVPYVFVKIFHLPINEQSLYIFNSLIMILSIFATIFLFRKIFKNKFSPIVISLFVAILYMFQYEVMQSQGMTYWVQSIFQLLFILQILCFMDRKNRKTSLLLFWLLCIIIPYSEWTGYVSNFGFLFAILIDKYKLVIKSSGGQCQKPLFKIIQKGLLNKIFVIDVLKNLCLFSLLTGFSFILFCFHYLIVVNSGTFFQTLKARFFARNIESSAHIIDLIKGYKDSFGYLLLIIALLFCMCIIVKKSRSELHKILKENLSIIVILFLPLFENILMKEHAISYSYDRMKAIFILIFVFLALIYSLSQAKIYREITIISFVIVSIISSFQLYNYTVKDNRWRWKVDYRVDNEIFAKYIYQKYNNVSVLGQLFATRGYTNLLFQRGVYEGVDIDFVAKQSKKLKKRYAIYLLPINETSCMYKYESAIVLDNKSAIYKKIIYNKDTKNIEEIHIDDIFLSKIIDQNWTNGVSNTKSMITFDNTDYNKDILMNAKALQYGHVTFHILSINKNGGYINVTISPKDNISILKNVYDGIKVLYN